jgi:hypothetical protein
VPKDTVVTVYNGAQDKLSATIDYLEGLFKTKVKLVTDPKIRADVVVTVGRNTPDLAPPPQS